MSKKRINEFQIEDTVAKEKLASVVKEIRFIKEKLWELHMVIVTTL